MNKKTKLDKINTKWFEKCECKLKNIATQAVCGAGSPSAEIVFIGEAPGKKEDELGKPFVGASGKFLAEMLFKIELNREDVYITNIVKYRPPNNRDPMSEEKSDCREWLLEELKIISPKLIVFLGRHALNNFFPTEKISQTHGKLLIKEFNDMPTKYFYALYHPAAALYDSSMKETLMNDFKKIPKILKNIEKE